MQILSVVATLLVAQAAAAPLPQPQPGSSGVLETREPKNMNGPWALKKEPMPDWIGTGDVKRSVESDEDAAEVDARHMTALETREPKNMNAPWALKKGPMPDWIGTGDVKRSVETAAEEEAEIEARDLKLETRDPKNKFWRFMDKLSDPFGIDKKKGNDKDPLFQGEKRSVETTTDEDAEAAPLEARSPKSGFWKFLDKVSDPFGQDKKKNNDKDPLFQRSVVETDEAAAETDAPM